jgi:hypothetical protein
MLLQHVSIVRFFGRTEKSVNSCHARGDVGEAPPHTTTRDGQKKEPVKGHPPGLRSENVLEKNAAQKSEPSFVEHQGLPLGTVHNVAAPIGRKTLRKFLLKGVRRTSGRDGLDRKDLREQTVQPFSFLQPHWEYKRYQLPDGYLCDILATS